MRSPALPLGLLTLALASLVALSCSDDGISTSCDEMVVTEYDDDNEPVNEDEVAEWWEQAAGDGCATAAEGGAGAPN